MQISVKDLSSAYLTARLDAEVFMKPLPGTAYLEREFDDVEGDGDHDGKVWKLNRPLYGLKNSGRLFHRQFRRQLVHEWKFQSGSADVCFFTKRRNGSMLRLAVFVDDLLVINDDTDDGRAMREEFERALTEKGQPQQRPRRRLGSEKQRALFPIPQCDTVQSVEATG